MKLLEGAEVLDPLVARLRGWSTGLLDQLGARQALQGQRLGHAVHPMLTDLPLGLWTATNVLDLAPLPGSRSSAQRLLALGLLAVPPVAMTGWAEWHEAEARDQRVGLVHAGM